MSCMLFHFIFGSKIPQSSNPGSKGSWQQRCGPLPSPGQQLLHGEARGFMVKPQQCFSPLCFNATGAKHTVKLLHAARLFHPGSAGCSFGGGDSGGGGEPAINGRNHLVTTLCDHL